VEQELLFEKNYLPVCGFAWHTGLLFRGVLSIFVWLWFRGAHLSLVSQGANFTICVSVVLRGLLACGFTAFYYLAYCGFVELYVYFISSLTVVSRDTLTTSTSFVSGDGIACVWGDFCITAFTSWLYGFFVTCPLHFYLAFCMVMFLLHMDRFDGEQHEGKVLNEPDRAELQLSLCQGTLLVAY
jgi:hypothetical protein